MLDIYDEFRSLVVVLDEYEIDYALCGGMAMAVHERPRMTIDIDVLILAESLDRVMAIATNLGYTIRDKDMSFANGAVEIRRVSKIDPESRDLLSLDLLLVTPQIREVWDSRIESEWEGVTLSVVSRAGLIALKQLRRSGQDLDDIKALEQGERDE
jgi:nucleotidyltransferase AbiEii toxin of type IV toxin-antitoxin system